jgi:biopolymer transport protein ExbB
VIGVLLALAVLQPSPERLRQAVEEARRELAAERERIKAEEKAQQKTLAELEGRLEKLSGQAVDLSFEAARLAKELEAARAEQARLREAAEKATDPAEELKYLAADGREKISDLLEALPPSGRRAGQADQLKLLADESRSPEARFQTLVELGLDLLEESATVERFETKVRTAGGAFEPATIARVGLVGFGYRTSGSGRLALAMGAAGGEKGYRWNETLTPAVRASLQGAFGSGPAGWFPLDVSQQMTADTRTSERTFEQWFRAGGPVMWPLAAVAALAALLILERMLYLAVRAAGAGRAAAAVLERCRASDFAEAERLAAQARGPVGRALHACMTHRAGGTAAQEDAAQEALLHEIPRLERFLPVIATLGTVAPMLGLLGTVTGMISTFNMITAFGTGDPGIMAGGISEALITTVAGLVIAIPVLLLHSYLSGRVERALADAERYAAGLINLLRDAGERRP